ncbi:hypothetical protein ACJIZ3_021465 [Penstemon smallii]|uniref:Uncharacterized protein n=1 Tax=Penstemon smallii TaxID=265156 RepID=A0ABD3SM19_9LAMI
MTTKTLLAYLFAVLLIQSCILYGVEARNVVKVTCARDQDCPYICPSGKGHCNCSIIDKTHDNCKKSVCICKDV